MTIILKCSKCNKPILIIDGDAELNEVSNHTSICNECLGELGIEMCCEKPMKIENVYNIHKCDSCGTVKRSSSTTEEDGIETRICQVLEA